MTKVIYIMNGKVNKSRDRKKKKKKKKAKEVYEWAIYNGIQRASSCCSSKETLKLDLYEWYPT